MAAATATMMAAVAVAVAVRTDGAGPSPAGFRKSPAQIAPYPPMQWHSFGQFNREIDINEANMLSVAEALVETGMAAAGNHDN